MMAVPMEMAVAFSRIVTKVAELLKPAHARRDRTWTAARNQLRRFHGLTGWMLDTVVHGWLLGYSRCGNKVGVFVFLCLCLCLGWSLAGWVGWVVVVVVVVVVYLGYTTYFSTRFVCGFVFFFDCLSLGFLISPNFSP
jgi:hypothetical protein